MKIEDRELWKALAAIIAATIAIIASGLALGYWLPQPPVEIYIRQDAPPRTGG